MRQAAIWALPWVLGGAVAEALQLAIPRPESLGSTSWILCTDAAALILAIAVWAVRRRFLGSRERPHRS
jgi:hypothetical protein